MRRLALVALVALVATSLGPTASAQRRAPERPAAATAAAERPRNVVYFVTDGFGPASVTMARDYVQATTGRRTLAFDPHVVGTVQTWATDSRVTDSAAGGTALASGVKTYNGAIGVDTTGMAVATVLEGAKARGMATGVVVTSRFTHATPAAFTAHVGSRAMEAEIARQQVALAPDVMMGGGRRFFLPPDVPGGVRRDGANLLDTLRGKGFTVATDRAGFDAARRAPFAAFFSNDHMAYEIDRDDTREPSLAEMTTAAIRMLEAKGGARGFFLMVEASRIDHAGHANDAAAHLHDILAFEAAWQVAVDYARRSGSTLVVSTSDHETGGLTLGRNGANGQGIYAWHPEMLRPAVASNDVVLPLLREAIASDTTGASALDVLLERLDLADLDATERDDLVDALRRRPGRLAGVVNEFVGRRALVAWTTTGHTAVDVNLYAYGPGSRAFAGNLPNDLVGRRVAELMRIDLAPLTRTLRTRIPRQARGPGE